MPPGPAVSVVVATHDRADRLARLVAALAGQEDGVAFEAVLVDDGSTDGTAAELDRLAATAPFPLTVLRRARSGGAAAARNVGWRAARAPLVAFTDDDCVPQPGWLAALVKAFARDGAGAVQGPTYPDPAQRRPGRPFVDTIHVPGPSPWSETANMAYRRDWLERLGGFDEGFGHLGGEDADLGWRLREAGGSVAFAPRAAVLHDVRVVGFGERLGGLARWEGIARVVARHPGLRPHLHRRWFWKPSHPRALAAAAGVALAGRGRAGAALALVMVAPYVAHRLGPGRLPGGLRSVPAIPLALVVDLAEVAVMARGSLRYRTLVL